MSDLLLKRVGKKNVVTVAQKFEANPFAANTLRDGTTTFFMMDPLRSKLAAAVLLGLEHLPKENDVILYLGASAGYTTSFLAHIASLLFAIELSPLMARELIFNVQHLPTIAPVLADAALPSSYAHRVCQVDYLFQDVSQKRQLQIFLDNIRLFLNTGGVGLMFLKTKSIDFLKNSTDIFKNVLALLHAQRDIVILQSFDLERYHKGHFVIVVKYAETV